MAVDLNVKVHLEEFKAKISEHTNLLNSKAKNLDVGKHSGEIESLNNMINMFVKSTKITQETLKGVNSNLRKFTDLIKELEAATSKTSDAYKEYDKQMKELASEREKLEEKRDALRKGVSVTSTGDIALRRGDLAKLYEEYQSSVTDANKIKGPKGKALQFQSFYSHYQNNASKLQNLDVKSNNSDGFLTIVKNEEARLAKELGDLDKSIEKLTDKINKLEVPEKMTNASSITEINRSFESTKSAGNLVQTVLQNQDDPKDTVSGRSVELNNRLDKQSGSINRAFKQFTLYAVALKTVKKALKEATATIKDLDKELTEQAMVTGMTREQTYGLMKTYQDLALATGATTKEVASVATEYIKQGKSIKEATILTEAAVSAAKVARVSVGDSVNYLTTALNGFRLSAEQAMLVSDKFAAVAASSATDYDELAIALSKVASQANLAGMSIDYTTALLTKGLETTREAPETMGTALKTIIARMRELGDYGETLEGDTDINNVETQLAYVDIALRNSQGELRSTEEVLDELGKKWDTLNKNQQAAIAKALAGTRQQSRLIAMMSDYERVTELQEISQRSAGATAAQASVYLEGMEASLNKITVAWEKIVTGLTDSEAII